MKKFADKFPLYDLKVEVVAGEKKMVCSHRIGDCFVVRGENLFFQKDMSFSMYAMAALLPLLPVKQRMTHRNDWVTTDNDIACPDPYCGGIFRIARIKKRIYRHKQTTVVPLKKEK